MKARIQMTVLIVLSLATASSGRAQNGKAQAAQEPDAIESAFGIDDRDPQRSIPSEAERNAKPLDFAGYLMTVSDKAEAAVKRGDHAQAAKFYQTLAKAVPDASVALIKLCALYDGDGQRDKAEQSCGDALSRQGVGVEDFAHYVRLVLAQTSPLSKAQIARVDAVVAHLKAQAGSLTVSSELACDLGVRLDDVKRLARCTAELEKSAPKSLKTVSYAWALALRRNDLAATERAIERAKQLGLKPEGLARMEEMTRVVFPSKWRVLRDKPISALLAVVAVAGLLVAARSLALRRRRTVRQQVSA